MPALSYTHIAANTAGTLIRTGRGVFSEVTINTKGATGNLLTVYDGTSTGGTVIASIDTTVAVGSFLYDVRVEVGIYVVLASGTAADLTIGWL